MFCTHEIKNSRRGVNTRMPPTEAELLDERADERTLPYFSIVPEQVLSDERYRSLAISHKAHFWLFIVHVLWRDAGRCIRHSGVISQRMGINVAEWDELEILLLDGGLLILSADNFYLIQPELRTQYLMTLETNNRKRHKKDC